MKGQVLLNNMSNKEITTVIINENYLKDKIYFIRGQKVMIDSDLASIYGFTTKRFNEQVKRNIDKFDNDFMFQIPLEDLPLNIRSQIATGSHRNKRFVLNVFTEQGIYIC